MPAHHNIQPETWWSKSRVYPRQCLPAFQGLSPQVSVTTSCRHPHSYHQQDLSGLLWWASYLTLHSSASGPTFSPSLHPTSSQINSLALITSPALVLVLLQPYPAVVLLMPLSRQSQPHTVTGSLAPHGPPMVVLSGSVYLLQLLRHSCPTSASIPAPYLAVYILQSSSRRTCLSPSASTAGTSALWGCVLQQDLPGCL